MSSRTGVTQRGRASSSASRRNAQNRRNPKAAAMADGAVLDSQTKRDILGVAVIVVAVALFVAALMPDTAIVSSLVSEWLHLIFGVGSYIVPFFLAAIGVTFIVQFQRQRVPTRVALGLALILLAVLGLIGVSTPVTNGQYDQLFLRLMLIDHGGYIGAGIAWLGCVLLGPAITVILLIGVIIIGVIIIGLSISKIIEKIRALHEARERELSSVEAPPFARIRRHRDAPVAMTADGDVALEAAPTAVLPQVADASSSQPTAVLPQRKPVKRRRTRQSLDEPAAEPSTSSAAVTRRLSPSKETDQSTITRKLSPTPKAEASPERAPAVKTASPVTPISQPHPQEGFTLPSMSLLKRSKNTDKDKISETELRETSALLQETLEDFGIMAQVVGWVAGPTVTLFKVDLPAGVRVSRVTALNDDIALALAAPGVRIFAPIPGTNYVGIEVPNRTRQTVVLSDVLGDAGNGPLQIAIGKDVEGHSIVSDLAKMPHLLIGGTTGSGKSVSINGMIMSILMRATPAEVRFIMIDPKRVEFTPYNGIPHLYVPVVTEAKEAASALSWGVAEMERRLKVFSKVGARNIGQYNAKVQQGEFEDEEEEVKELPYIVIIIDELADLMMNVGKEVEFSISRIAQLARAAGIHLIVATQRPSANVVTGLIKSNITNRIAFNVASGIDSRVILDTPGAENLIGLGDLLLSKPEYAKPQRIQGCYVSEEEINAVVEVLKAQGEPEYHSEILQTNLITLGASSPDGSDGGSGSEDPLLWEAADIVVSSGLGSTSNIQRRLKVGYSRAGRIMDQLEEKGVVGPPNGSKPRDVLVDTMELETLKAFEMNDDGS